MRITFELKTVTPLFLAGANQNHAELRPASFRGMLRYWFRAAAGSVVGDSNTRALFALESKYFGNAGYGSPIDVRLSSQAVRSTTEPLLPHRHDNTAGNAQAVEVGVRFNLTLSLKPGVSAEILEMAVWSALLALTLGGLGRRSRRGAGSVRIAAVSGDLGQLPSGLQTVLQEVVRQVDSVDDLVAAIRSIRNGAQQAFNGIATAGNLNSPPAFSVLQASTRTVVWEVPGSDSRDYKTALEPLMNKMSDLNATLGGDYRKAFGGIGRSTRRASPLHVTAYPLAETWVLVLTYLEAEYQRGMAGSPQEGIAFLDDLGGRQAYPYTIEEGELL